MKKIIYLISAAILGILLSLIAHAAIEMTYLNWAQRNNVVVVFYNNCALLPIFQIIILAIGAVGGLFLGNFWWRKIYIERAWKRK